MPRKYPTYHYTTPIWLCQILTPIIRMLQQKSRPIRPIFYRTVLENRANRLCVCSWHDWHPSVVFCCCKPSGSRFEVIFTMSILELFLKKKKKFFITFNPLLFWWLLSVGTKQPEKIGNLHLIMQGCLAESRLMFTLSVVFRMM